MPFPFRDIGLSVLETAPQVVYNPALGVRFLFYWTMVAFVSSQYARTLRLQGFLYGREYGDPVRLTAVAMLEGLVVGLAGSYVMTFFGISLLPDGGGMIWVLGTALALMLLNVRFMCFAYAGGLVSLCSLLFGFPQVSIPSLMGLVAVLHLMESLLIFLNGAAGATPVPVERQGRPIGAFQLQRYWPVPICLLILAVISPVEAAQGGIAMPDWWPLFRTTPEILAHPGAVFFLHALPATLGYGDLAVTGPPVLKARRTAGRLALYSLVLLGFSVLATRWEPLIWAAALFAPLGHEAVVRIGNRLESAGTPYFVPPAAGTMVLDALPGTLARELGLGPGWVVTAVNGRPVTGRAQLEESLRAAADEGRLVLDVIPPDFHRRRRSLRPGPRRLEAPFHPGGALGVVTVPEPGDQTYVEVAPVSLGARLLRRLLPSEERPGPSGSRR